MKRLLTFIGLLGIIIGSIYLYQKQLGAIPFLLLSIYFFAQAFKQLSNKPKQSDEVEKENKNDRYS
ncbi:hypothetical protein ACFYKT_16975 [Cytobacillus sp. FJAT-53684]|uniref:DUF3953 domain-containing protein n=1 Tax=Cytobacillus mangrovibacter TaxID=3299024 RepID=A0ABW6K1K7_9BACI